MSDIPDRLDIYHPEGGFATVPSNGWGAAKDEGSVLVKPEDAELFRTKNKGRVVVFSETGERATIPRSSLGAAQKGGYRVANYDESVQFLLEKEVETDPSMNAAMSSFMRKPEDSAHGPEAEADQSVIQPGQAGDEALAGGERISQYLDDPEVQQQRAAEKAEREHYETQGPLAGAQGLTRWVGGDYIREALDKYVESPTQDALSAMGIDRSALSEYDMFQDRETVAKNRQYNPGWAAIGEMGSVVIPTILTGGTSTAASAAELTAPALIGTGAKVIGQGAAKLGIPKLAAPVATVVEGGAYGALGEVNDAFLNRDYDNLGEKILSGFALGAGTSAALGGLVAAAPAAMRVAKGVSAVDDVADDVVFTPALRPAKNDVSQGDDFPLIGTVQPQGRLGKLGEWAQTKLTSPEVADDIHQDLLRETRSRFNKFYKAHDEVADAVSVAAKRRHVETAFTGELGDGEFFQFSYGTGAVRHFRQQVGILPDDLEALFNNKASAGKGARAILRNLNDHLQGIEDDIFGEVDEASKGRVFVALDQQKRSLGEAAESCRNPYVQRILRTKYEQIRNVLQDPKVWGEQLAREQTIVNQKWAEFISATKHGGITKMFMDGSKPAVDPFRRLQVVNDKYLAGLMRGLGRAENETAESAMVSYLDAAIADMRMRSSLWGSAQLVEKTKQLEVLANEIKYGMGVAKTLNSRVAGKGAKSSGLLGAVGGGALAVGGLGAEAASGGLATMAGGVATGLAAQGVLKKAAAGVQTRATRSMFQTINQAVDAQTRLNKAANMATKVEKALKTPAAKAVKTGASATITNSYLDELNQWIESLFSDDPGGGPHSILMRVKDEAPEALPSVVAGLQRQRDFLTEKLQDPNLDRRQMVAYVEAARDPLDALERLGDGDATPEHLEAVKAISPGIYAEFTQRALAGIDDAPYQAQLAIKARLGLPQASPEKMAALQTIAESGIGAEAVKEESGGGEMLSPSRRREPRLKSIYTA